MYVSSYLPMGELVLAISPASVVPSMRNDEYSEHTLVNTPWHVFTHLAIFILILILQNSISNVSNYGDI